MIRINKHIGARVLAAFLTAFLLVGGAVRSVGAAETEPTGSTSSVGVTLDGTPILQGEAMLLQSVTYVPLRRFCELAGADSITWNGTTQTATVKKGSMTMQVTDGAYYVIASGRYFYTVQPIVNIGDRLFVPIRPLVKAFSMELTWNGTSRTVVLRTTGKTLKSGSEYYSADDVYWLSRIISAEAGGESLPGQLAVGDVVLNRVAHKQYPNTVYGVIFDRVGGVQFSPVALGTVYRTPTASSVIAAKICLEGTVISDEILFFMNPRIATGNWISKNRPFAFTIGNHDFYR